MSKPEITYARPLNWGELEELQREYQSQIMYLANGDYHPKAREGKSILVDLQDLELDQAELYEDGITLGGLVNLHQLGVTLESAEMEEAISIEAGVNLRNSLSLTNYVKASHGRSAVQLCLNALEAEYHVFGDAEFQRYSPALKAELGDSFIEEVKIANPVSLAFASAARSPKDQPVVAVAASKRSESRIHVACGGAEAMLAEFDLYYGEEDGEAAIRNLYKDCNDEWAGAEYRQDVATVLLSRCLQKLWRDSHTKEAA